MDNRIYYFHHSDGTKSPDEEAMVSKLLDVGVLYCYTEKVGEKSFVSLYILVNDYFVPAADGESLESEDNLVKLFDLYQAKGYDGVYEFVANKRGIPNKHWRDA